MPGHRSAATRAPALLVALLSVAGANSCGSPASSVVITGFYALTISAQSNGTSYCTMSGTELTRGLMYSQLPAPAPANFACCGYTVGVEIKNNMPTQIDTNTPQLQTDQHTVDLTTLTTTYSFIPAQGGTPVTLGQEVWPLNAVLQSGGQVEQFTTPILSTGKGGGLEGQTGELDVTLAFSGETTDGTEVKVAPVMFPVDVVNDPPPTCQATEVESACTADSWNQGDGYLCTTPG